MMAPEEELVMDKNSVENRWWDNNFVKGVGIILTSYLVIAKGPLPKGLAQTRQDMKTLVREMKLARNATVLKQVRIRQEMQRETGAPMSMSESVKAAQLESQELGLSDLDKWQAEIRHLNDLAARGEMSKSDVPRTLAFLAAKLRAKREEFEDIQRGAETLVQNYAAMQREKEAEKEKSAKPGFGGQ